jgi:hypothetical protein
MHETKRDSEKPGSNSFSGWYPNIRIEPGDITMQIRKALADMKNYVSGRYIYNNHH